MHQVFFEDLGLMDYELAWQYQAKLFQANVDKKLESRKLELQGIPSPCNTINHLLFVEHPHVYTLGKSAKATHLLASSEELRQLQASVHQINRGGDITYHGFGQLVVYPIFDLENFYTDIHRFLRELEEAVILTLQEFGIASGRLDGFTGVWLDPEIPELARKICAMGIRCSRWITMHGIALNVNTDLSYFEHIVPCGIKDKAVSSMQAELGSVVDIQDVKEHLKSKLSQIFNINIVVLKN